MAKNDPSPEDIANLEQEQREAELQAEFDEFERQENERVRKQQEYDMERARIEREYTPQKTEPRTYTGIRTVDDYLDKADIKAETKASGRRIKDTIEVEKLQKSGKITPEYAEFRKGQIAEKYEKQKKSDARIVIEGGKKYASGLVAGASGYLDNMPASRGGGARRTSAGRKSAGKTKPKATGGFTSGVGGFSGVAFPQFGSPQFGSPAPTPHGKRRQQPQQVGPSFPGLSVGIPKSSGGKKKSFSSGMKFGSGVTKGEGIKLNIGSPFGKKKTSPLKGRKKSLW